MQLVLHVGVCQACLQPIVTCQLYDKSKAQVMMLLQGKVMKLLRKHARKGCNFVVICGNTKVGAPGGCRDALEYVLDDLEEHNLEGAAFVYTPSKSAYLAGPSFRYGARHLLQLYPAYC